jgi:hypothetical protein
MDNIQIYSVEVYSDIAIEMFYQNDKLESNNKHACWRCVLL